MSVEQDEAMIRPVERMPVPLEDDDPAPVAEREPEPVAADDADPDIGGDDAEPRRTMTAEEKLRRSRSETKRLRREAAAKDRTVAELAQRLANVEQGLTAGQQASVQKAEADTLAAINDLRAQRRAAMAEGNTDLADDLDEKLYSARRHAEKIAEYKGQQSQRRPVHAAQQAPGWVAEWQSENRWYGKDHEATSDAIDISNRLAAEGVRADSAHHRTLLDRELRANHPHLYQQRRAGGQAVAGSPRGGAMQSGRGSIPPVVEAQLRRSGHNLDDPKVRADLERRFGERWKTVPRGS